MSNKQLHIGFVSTRFAGTDGVSLETVKWSGVLDELGCSCYYFAGESDLPETRTYIVPEAHFNHQTIKTLNIDLFDDYKRSSETSGEIQRLRFFLKDHLYKFKNKYKIDILIVENAFAIPMNIPLGLALTEFIAETDIPTIAHHHDFYWERDRFSVTSAQDYLQSSFPPTLHSITHVVINSYGGSQLGLRTGVSSSLIPNVMDFDSPPENDGYAEDLRNVLSIAPDEYFLLQPTRIVPRKRIQLAIELIRRLKYKAVLVISHASGDEGDDYSEYLREYADLVGVRLIFAAHLINQERQTRNNGDKIYTLEDFYQQADLVTYPSTIEGFGNAFLEAIYYKKPIFMSEYEIFKTDIKPKGFQVVNFNEFITDEVVKKVEYLLLHPDSAKDMILHNYNLGKKYYSFTTLKEHLAVLLKNCISQYEI
ncbi:MAG: glycosyltransferase family 4 protein [Spirochaetales bacterium]|nr:glycosyltransferase family 4 protein [Spirochaetales bacterium]